MAGRKPSMRSKGSDLCNGIHYNDATHSLAALIHTKSKQWRLGPKVDDFNDAVPVIPCTLIKTECHPVPKDHELFQLSAPRIIEFDLAYFLHQLSNPHYDHLP